MASLTRIEFSALLQPTLLGRFGARPLLLCLMMSLTAVSTPAVSTTLYKCKLDGKTVFSDTDCPRTVHIKKAAKSAKPRVIKIRQKTTAAKGG